MKGNRNPIRIGARGSKLSLTQANLVMDLLRRAHPDFDFELQIIKTGGDADQQTALRSMGGTGIFVKELEAALERGEIDLAVHSAKDLPSVLPPGFCLAAVPDRAPVEDALVAELYDSIESLPAGAKIATGSPRRQAQLLHIRPDLQMVDVRGNVDTRLRKLAEGQFDAIILARAGLQRLGLEHQITQVLSPAAFLPAPGQGALAIEIRDNDDIIEEAAKKINQPRHYAEIEAERALLATLQAGCTLPVGAHATWGSEGQLRLAAVVLNRQGTRRISNEREIDDPGEADKLGRAVAEDLIQQGAKELLNE